MNERGIEMVNKQDLAATARDGRIRVLVNEQSVTLEGVAQTSANIKRVAIEQGVSIDESFIFSIELDEGRTQLVSDEQEIEVYDDERFLAIADDDNS